jgi:hypothetical protein
MKTSAAQTTQPAPINTYRVIVLSDRDPDLDDDRAFGPATAASSETGLFFTLPFTPADRDLLALALEQVGIFDPKGFTIEDAVDDDYIIRARDGSPFLIVGLYGEAPDEGVAYSPYTGLDGHDVDVGCGDV